jgi:glycosyltransferase involved in cell wall biosynthesis
MPKVSVIIPNYNHADFLEKRILSVAHQTFQDLEIILLDDASTDNSLDIIRKYETHPKVASVAINSQNSGLPFLQWKRGIDQAKGEYIWIAESDDWNEPDFLETLIPYLEQEPATGVVFCRSFFVNELDEEIEDYSLLKEEALFDGKSVLTDQMAYYNIIHNASSVVFRKALAPIYSESVLKKRFCGDWLFWSLILTQSNLAFCNQKLNYYRRHSSSVSSEKASAYRYFVEGIDIPILIFKTCCLDNLTKLKLLRFWSQKFRGTLYRKRIFSYLNAYFRFLGVFSKTQLDLSFLSFLFYRDTEVTAAPRSSFTK